MLEQLTSKLAAMEQIYGQREQEQHEKDNQEYEIEEKEKFLSNQIKSY